MAAYDVRDKKRLRAALRILKGYSTGGQKSVFECWLTEGEVREMMGRVRAALEEEDRFFLVRLDPRSRVVGLGVAVPPADGGYFYVG